jgi:GT2 family glycosyltransferase
VIAPVPHAAIVIPHYNDTRRLRLCLEALAPQVAAHPVELVVVDNGSTEDIAPVRAAFPWARFLTEPEKGAAAARNTGVAATTAPRLFFTDADCIPAPDWVAVALAQPDGDAMVGGRVDLFDETPPPRSGAEAFETVFGFPQRSYISRQRYSVTANLLTTRAVFAAAGPFRAGVSEDWDWCNRAWDRGYPIRYEDSLCVRHPARSDWDALRRKWRRTTSEMFQVNGTRPAQRLRWALRAGIVLASGVPHQVRVLRHPALTPLEKWRGGLTLLRLRALRAGWMLRQAVTGR